MAHSSDHLVEAAVSFVTIDEVIEAAARQLSDVHRMQKLVLQLDGAMEQIEAETVRALGDVACQCFVLAIQSSVDGKFCIVWRKEAELFAHTMFGNISKADLVELCPFVAEFLSECLENDHSGIADEQVDRLHVVLSSLTDCNGLNLFLHAVQCGHTRVVEILLRNAVSDVNRLHNGRIAADYAYVSRHHEALAELLRSNSMFPMDFAMDECEGEVRELAVVSAEFHEHIRCGNVEAVRARIETYPNLRYFFSLENQSALATAIGHRQFALYELLVANNLYFAPREQPELIMAGLDDAERAVVRDIHFRHKKEGQEQHLNALMPKCFVGHDEFNVQDKLNRVWHAFRILNGFAFVQILLKVAAVLSDLHIVFDFNRDSVHYLDPTQGSNIQGLFYGNGRIYVGAKQLLDEDLAYETFATIAHELCHYVLFIVFGNFAKPYKACETALADEFAAIASECRAKQHLENIVGVVFDPSVYLPENHHAELIVRVPHMLAHYHNWSAMIERLQLDFQALFRFYELKIVPALETALVELRTRAENEAKREIRKQKRKVSQLKRVVVLVVVFLSLVAVLTGVLVYEPILTFADLSTHQRQQVFNGKVRFEDLTMPFSELYGTNESSGVFGALNSQQIKRLLSGDLLDLSAPSNVHLEAQILLTSRNLSAALRERTAAAVIEFQGETVQVATLLGASAGALIDSLHSKDMLALLKNQSAIRIGRRVIANADSYIDRRFVDKARDINRRCYDAREFRYNECYSEDEKRALSVSALDLIAESERTKLVLLVDDAGMGKSTAFRNFAVESKRLCPLKWIEYVDLKEHMGVYEKHRDVLETLAQVFGLNGVESEVLKALYDTGSVVILWDGFDEISPTYSDFMLRLISQIKHGSRNVQYLSSRPHYEKSISEAFNCTVHNLLPYMSLENDEYLRRIYVLEKLSEFQVTKARECVATMIAQVQGKSKFYFPRAHSYIDSPLLLQMIAELSVESADAIDVTGLYTIYESLIKRKVRISSGKGDLAQRDREKILITSHVNLIEIFQYYAIKSARYEAKYDGLRIMKRNKNIKLDIYELSRYGILIFDANGKAEFVHRTFQEFFLAQYFVDNVYDMSDDLRDEEILLRLQFMFGKLVKSRLIEPKVHEFFYSFRANRTWPANRDISRVLETHWNSIFYDMASISSFTGELLEDFNELLALFPFESSTLEVLWGLRNESTFFTWWATRSLHEFAENFDRIVRIVGERLGNQTERWLRGRHQRGNLLYAVYGELKYAASFASSDFFDHLNATLEFDPMKLKDFDEFIQFYMFVNLTRDESRQLFITNFIKLAVTEDISFWVEMGKVFTQRELQEIIYAKTRTSEVLYETDSDRSALRYIRNLTLVRSLLPVLEGTPNSRFLDLIYEEGKYLLFDEASVMADDNFERIWTAIVVRTNKGERRKILSLPLFNYDNFLAKRTFFVASIDFGTPRKFEIVKDLYLQHFNSSEMRSQCVKYFEIKRDTKQWPQNDTVEAFEGLVTELFTADEIKERFREVFGRILARNVDLPFRN